MEQTKTCTKCKRELTLDSFATRLGAKDGRRGVCKDCKRNGHSAWREANREHVRKNGRETMAKLYASNPEKFRQATRTYYAQNREKAKQSHNVWKSKNQLHIVEYSRTYRAANLESVNEKNRLWQINNPSACLAHKQKARDTISKAYAAQVLQIPVSEATPDLIELKRQQLQIYRLTKQLNQAIKEKQNAE